MSVRAMMHRVFGFGAADSPANGAPMPLLLLLTAAIFGLDLAVPRGITIATLYASVVMLSLWSRNRWVVLSTTAACSVLSILGAWLSPEGQSFRATMIDRGLSIAVLWQMAILGLMYRRADYRLWESLDAQRRLNSELDHRVRNSMAGLDALVTLIEQQGGSPERVADRVRYRIRGLLLVHTQLSRAGWGFVPLRRLLDDLIPGNRRSRVTLEGPDVEVSARQAPPLVLLLQELFENAVRYGSLSEKAGPGGSVRATWTVEPTAQAGAVVLRFAWVEAGGPEIVEPPKPGVGMGLIEGFAMSELGGTASFSFAREGASHRVELTLDTPEPNIRTRQRGSERRPTI